MKLQVLSSQYQKIQSLFSEAKSFGGDQIELRAHWARYLCVLSSGLLEAALHETFSAYARSCSNAQVANFVEANLRRIQNPKAGRFVEIAGMFNKSWADELEQMMELDGKGDAINAIISNRHLIAHGKNSDITLARLKEYLDKAVIAVEFIEAKCGI